MHLKLSTLTKEYIRVPVEAREGSVIVNPTTDVVAFAFMASGKPTAPAFTTGAWETDGSAYFARIVVGGTGTGATKELAAGVYAVWLKVTDSPEVPVRMIGTLEMV